MSSTVYWVTLSLFFQTFAVMAADLPAHYPHDLSENRWHHSGSRFSCSLKYDVQGVGTVSVMAQAGNIETLSLAPDPFTGRDRQVTVSLDSAPWQPAADNQIVAHSQFYEGDPLLITISTLTLVNAFQQGKQLTIQVTADAHRDATIQITALNIQSAAKQFYHCMDDLLVLNFEQARQNSFYYPPDALQLDTEQQKLLTDIAEYVAVDGSVQQIIIDAHTDSFGYELVNRDLSKRRGQWITDFLQQLGLPADKILMRFHGERYPVADNRTKAGRDKNRRVEIRLVR